MEGVPSRLRFHLSRRSGPLPLPTTPAFPSLPRLVSHRPSSGWGCRFGAFLLSHLPAGSMPADFCRCGGFCSPPMSQRNVLGDGKSAGRGRHRETRRSHAPRNPVRDEVENPTQATETNRAPAKPCYETEMRGEFRGGGTVSANGLPAVTGVASDFMFGSYPLPARGIGRPLPPTPLSKSQAPAVLERVSVRPRVGSSSA